MKSSQVSNQVSPCPDLIVQVRWQVGAGEAVRHWEAPLPLDHQEQEPPMGQIDISLAFDEKWAK